MKNLENVRRHRERRKSVKCEWTGDLRWVTDFFYTKSTHLILFQPWGRLYPMHYCLPTRIWKPNDISADLSGFLVRLRVVKVNVSDFSTNYAIEQIINHVSCSLIKKKFIQFVAWNVFELKVDFSVWNSLMMSLFILIFFDTCNR